MYILPVQISHVRRVNRYNNFLNPCSCGAFFSPLYSLEREGRGPVNKVLACIPHLAKQEACSSPDAYLLGYL